MNFLLVLLVIVAVALTQVLAGGRDLALSLPGFGILAMAAFLSWWPRRKQPIREESGECLAAAAIFFLYISIRALFSPDAYVARNDLFTAQAAMALYLLVALNLTSSKSRLFLVAALLVLGVANSAIGAVQFFKGQNFGVIPFLPLPSYGARASGFYGYPNHLAGFLEMTVLLALAATFWGRWPSWAKIVAGYASVACLLGLVLTGSRGAYISCAIGLLVFVFLSLVLIGKVGANRAIVLILVGALLIGAGAWGMKRLVSKSFVLESRSEKTLTVDVSRMRLWQAAWKQFRLSPVVGTGSGTYLYYGRQFRNPRIQPDPVHAHDDYFEMLAEYGIIGIITAVIFLETHLRRGWTSFKRRISGGASQQELASNSLALNIGAISAASACLVHCLLDFNLHITANVLVAAIIFGVLANPTSSQEAPEEEGLPAFLRLALPAVGVWIAIVALPTFPAEFAAERAQAIIAQSQHLNSEVELEKLEALVRKGLSFDDRNPELHLDLANVYETKAFFATDPATQKELREQSVGEYRRALELSPQDVRMVLDLAWSFEGAKQFEDSGPLFERALSLDPNSAHVNYAYASHLEATGKFADAATYYQKSLWLENTKPAQAGLDRVKAQLTEPPPGPGGNPPRL